EATDSEGANQVTITTSVTLRRRISAARMVCDLFLIILWRVRNVFPRRSPDSSFKRLHPALRPIPDNDRSCGGQSPDSRQRASCWLRCGGGSVEDSVVRVPGGAGDRQ